MKTSSPPLHCRNQLSITENIPRYFSFVLHFTILHCTKLLVREQYSYLLCNCPQTTTPAYGIVEGSSSHRISETGVCPLFHEHVQYLHEPQNGCPVQGRSELHVNGIDVTSDASSRVGTLETMATKTWLTQNWELKVSWTFVSIIKAVDNMNFYKIMSYWRWLISDLSAVLVTKYFIYFVQLPKKKKKKKHTYKI